MRTITKCVNMLVLGGLTAAVSPGAVQAQTHYIVTDLGVLPGNVSSTATALNDLGDVVGYCSPVGGDDNATAFVWHKGSMKSVGKLPKGNYSLAMTINSLGDVAGDGDMGNFRPQGWVNTRAGMINFFSNNGGNTRTFKITDSGAIGGYYTKSLSGATSSWRGAIWTPDPKDPRKYKMTDLPILYGLDPTLKSTNALPFAFNQVGQAAGWAVNEVIGQHAAFWNNNAAHTIVDLGTLPGDGSSVASGINDLGQVVGESHPSFSSRPTFWDCDPAHTASELPLLPGDNFGTAYAINRQGEVLGWSAYAIPATWNVGPPRYVVWQNGAVYEIQSLLDPITGAGWNITYASAINNYGQIAANGLYNGQNHAILLTPAP